MLIHQATCNAEFYFIWFMCKRIQIKSSPHIKSQIHIASKCPILKAENACVAFGEYSYVLQIIDRSIYELTYKSTSKLNAERQDEIFSSCWIYRNQLPDIRVMITSFASTGLWPNVCIVWRYQTPILQRYQHWSPASRSVLAKHDKNTTKVKAMCQAERV